MPAHGSRCHRRISANFKLAGEEFLHTLRAAEYHDEVNGFYAKLRSPTAASHLNKCRSAPSTRRAASDYAFAFFSSEDKSAFDHVRYDGHALCVPHDVVGNALVGC